MQVGCNGLRVCVSSKFIRGNSHLQSTALSCGASGRWLGHECEVLMNQICLLIQGTPETFLSSSYNVRIRHDRLPPGRESSAEPNYTGTLISDFPFTECEKSFLVFKLPAYILLPQLEPTKTDANITLIVRNEWTPRWEIFLTPVQVQRGRAFIRSFMGHFFFFFKLAAEILASADYEYWILTFFFLSLYFTSICFRQNNFFMVRLNNVSPINFKTLLQPRWEKVANLKLCREWIMCILRKIVDLEAASGHWREIG